MKARAIPCLPLISLDETSAFYGWLGFEVTHRQTSPNVYLALERGALALHFFGLRGLKPEAAYSTCLVMVPEVENLHALFASALRQALGKVPTAGFPRISRMKPGQSRFTVVDPAGNSVIYIRAGAPDNYDEDESELDHERANRPLVLALRTAARLRDFRNDDRAAAKLLDVALRKHADAPGVDRARALAALAEIALASGEEQRASELRAELGAIPLSGSERAEAHRELDALTAAVAALAPEAPTEPSDNREPRG